MVYYIIVQRTITKRQRASGTFWGKEKNMADMNMSEVTRLILDLRAAGWDDTKIINHILYIETGEEKYKAKQLKEKAE